MVESIHDARHSLMMTRWSARNCPGLTWAFTEVTDTESLFAVISWEMGL